MFSSMKCAAWVPLGGGMMRRSFRMARLCHQGGEESVKSF